MTIPDNTSWSSPDYVYEPRDGELVEAILDMRDENRRLKRKNGFLCWGLVVLAFAFVGLFLFAVGSGFFAAATVSGILGVAALAGGLWGEK